MQHSLIQQGVDLMVFGMGTVFVFLAVLVVATNLMSRLVQRFDKPEPPVPAGSVGEAAAADDTQLVAVISAAINKYRSRR